MVTTIQQALCPFFVMCFIIGLGFHPRKQSKWIKYLSSLYFLIIWFVYAYLLYYTITLFTLKTLFRTLTVIIVMVLNIFTLIVSVIISFYNQKKFIICLKKLALVDDTLEYLGNPKMYRKMLMWSKGIVIVWIIYSLTINFYEALMWQNLKILSWRLCLPHILNHSLHINTLVVLLFISFVWYIGVKFDKVNEHMRYLLVREKHEQTWKKPVIVLYRHTSYIDNCKEILWISMHLHLELCRLARELNLIFGMQMTFEMVSYLLHLTELYYYLCVTLMYERIEEIYSIYWFNTGLWIFVFSFKLHVINHVCENVTVKANKTDKIIHQLTNICQYANIWKEIHQFTLQIMQHPLKFSGMGFFFFGNAFLWKFYMTVMTFIIIMMQLKIP